MSETPYEPDANLHVVKFERTPIMSTYLVAFVIGEVSVLFRHMIFKIPYELNIYTFFTV